MEEWPGSFTCHCGNTGVERTPNKSHHTKLTLEKKKIQDNAAVVIAFKIIKICRSLWTSLFHGVFCPKEAVL